MADRIQLKRSDVPGRVPVSADLAVGELAVNTADGKLFVKLADGSVVQVGGSGGGSVVAIKKSQLFTGDGTWTRPANMIGTQVQITGIGGGASGNSNASAGAGQGGDGGQWVIDAVVDIGAAASVVVTVGDGGARPPSGSAGNAGEPTSFGSFLTLLGGAAVTGSARPIPLGAPGRNAATATGQWMYGGDTPLGYGGSNYNAGNVGVGGGGLVLDDSGITAEKSGIPANTTPAVGYGAGGSTGVQGRAGAPGALKVSWWERVEVES